MLWATGLLSEVTAWWQLPKSRKSWIWKVSNTFISWKSIHNREGRKENEIPVSHRDKFGLCIFSLFWTITGCITWEAVLFLKIKYMIWKEIKVFKEWIISCFHDDASSCVSCSDLYLILEYHEISSVLWNGKCATNSGSYAYQVVLEVKAWLRS